MENPVKVRKTIKAQDLERNAPDVEPVLWWGKNATDVEKANHFASKCRSNPPKVHTVNESATESDTDSDQSEHFYIGEISANRKQDEVFVPVKLSTGSKAKAVSFKLDTGAQVNVLLLKLYRKLIRSSSYTLKADFNPPDKLQWQPFESRRKGLLARPVQGNNKDSGSLCCSDISTTSASSQGMHRYGSDKSHPLSGQGQANKFPGTI